MRGEMSGRAIVPILLIGMLVIVPFSSVSGEISPNGLELVIEIDEQNGGLYHTNEAPLEVTVKIQNHGDVSREVTYNPACPFDLVIHSDSWSYDLDNHRVCPTQERAITIQPGQTRVIATLDWDWADAPSGTLILEFEQPESSLSTTSTVEYHSIIEMPDNLELQAVLGETIGEQIGHTDSMPAMFHLKLVNTGHDIAEIPFDESCQIMMTIDELVSSLTEIGCGSGILDAGESISLGWTSWNFDHIDDGMHSITFTMTGVEDSSTSVDTMYTQSPFPSRQTDLVPSVRVELGEELKWEFIVENVQDQPAKLVFDNLCITEIHVISPEGGIIYDSRTERDCLSSGNQLQINSGTIHTLESNVWNLRDSNDCEINDGLHLLVITQPDYNLVSTQSFDYVGESTGDECRAAAQDSSSIRFAVNNLQILDADSMNERMLFDIQLENLGMEDFDLYWATDCSLEMTLSQNQQIYRTWNHGCGNSGQILSLSPSQSFVWSGIEVSFVDEGVALENGTWVVTIRSTSSPNFFVEAAHTFDGPHVTTTDVVEVPEVIDIVDEKPTIEEIPSNFILEGKWHYVTQTNQGCWLLTDSTGTERSFVAHMQNGGWAPIPGLTGTYDVEETPAAGDCAAWTGFAILSTIEEDVPAVVIEEPIITSKPIESPTDVVLESAPTVAAAVATTSLSIMVMLYITNTEWIRIPALQLGIGLVGMVRKTREHDGEYQRGRIMGYLTANPGVHFRALLGALNMSNGQLTHHLKSLQGEERVWRRKDGRLVRFYPASIQPSTQEDDLPVPLLTPDPNSLQGKILRLLDATENDIVNLSQKELAVRLEASQQLISHHLRTLEKFGLIEREKVGMRYRYQLTREAIFLVNNNEFEVDGE